MSSAGAYRPRVLLVNPNTNADTTATMAAILRRALAAIDAGVDVEGATAPFGRSMIVDADALAEAARAVETLAKDLGRTEPPAAVVVSAFGDPGLAAVRRLLDAPSVGIGSTSLADAAAGDEPFAVATTTPGLISSIDALVATLGLEKRYVGTFVSSGDPLALMADRELLKASLDRAVAAAVGRGARSVVIGGGPLAEIAPHLDAQGARLVQPIVSAARAVAHLLLPIA